MGKEGAGARRWWDQWADVFNAGTASFDSLGRAVDYLTEDR